ncbi:SGNH/GDSL hydrolase family protein [Patescibacteria group bacterium]
MKRPSRKFLLTGLLVAFISATLALLFSEWIIRRVHPQNTLQQAQLTSPRVFKKSKLVPSSLLNNLDTQHIALTREFSSHYTTNSLGYRGPEFTVKKPANTYRILMLGDSLTFGWGVEDNQTFSYLLPDFFDNQYQGKNLEIINAGFYDGYAPDNYYAYLKAEGLELEPDLVILNLFPWNDISDLKEMVWETTDDQNLPTSITSTDRIVRNGYHTEPVTSNWKFRLPILKNSHLAILAMNNLEQNSPQLVEKIKTLLKVHVPDNIKREEAENCIYQLDCTQRMTDLWQKLDTVILGINNLLLSNQTPLLVHLLPAHTQTIPLVEKLIESSRPQPQQRFKDFFDKNQITYLDSLPYFLDHDYQNYFYSIDGHPNEKGHQRLATALADYLNSL